MQSLITRILSSKRSLAALVLFLSSLSLSRAQDYASITGVVTDSSGAVIPNASVILVNDATSVSFKTQSNSEGSYTFANVPPGPGYKITFTAEGFKISVITGLYLNVNSTRTQNARLEVGGATQTVEVSASSETVTLNTTDASVGNNFQVQFMQDLPVEDRDSPAALFTQQPGVTLDGAVTGARTDQSNVTVDGLDVNDAATGCFGCIVANAPVDSVQEFRAVTAGELSSAGEGGGGQYELVTRGGTNSFHGDVNEYHRDTDTEANSWFNNDAGVPRSPLIRNQFGGSIGGPIKRDRIFFFFNYDGRRDTLASNVERTVPYTAYRNGEVAYNNNTGTVSTLTAAQVQAFDPANMGFDSALLSDITSRYPAANDTTGDVGDLINTAGYRFNAPTPYTEDNYTSRIDVNLTHNQKLWGKEQVTHLNQVWSPVQFPGDPETYPHFDKSYAYAIGHTWSIGNNKVNQLEYGEVREDLSWPNTYNPTGANQFSFGSIPSGGDFMAGPYASAINAQARTYPIPVIRDDFSWEKGEHSFQFGGTFKWVSPNGSTILNYNTPNVGLGGHLSNLQASMRPSDIATDSYSISTYDAEYTFALGRFSSVGATYNYNAQGTPLTQGSGLSTDYRYYETEVYFGDTWKLTPRLTISYGVRWQNYSVPYEIHGIESLPNTDFNQLFDARVAQSAAGAYGPSTDCSTASGGVPCVSYVLGGKANHAAGYFGPQWDNLAPRLAFSWTPFSDRKTVVNGGGGIVFDHTVINAIQYQATQYSYLFQSNSNTEFGVTGNPTASLNNDPRFSGFTTPPAAPAPPSAIKPPYTPWISSSGLPYGLPDGGAFNEGVDSHLRTPYSIQLDLGLQQEFKSGFLLKMSYVGRLGRRLLGQADANQLIDFPDATGGSSQTMSQAFGSLAQQVRSNPGLYLSSNPNAVTPQPWFEDMLSQNDYGLTPGNFGVPNWTAVMSNYIGTLAYRGDFADTMQALSGAGILPDNVGMGQQFSEFTYYTNKGFSSYNGMLVTLHKNYGYGLQFDLNYTWAHSIDNVSVVANAPAIGGYGFICDVLRPRLCRGNSDFDVANYISGNFIYELPFGRGKEFGTNTPFWLNEAVGGWEISGLPYWHTGGAYFAASNAFVAGYANDAPAILTGSIGDMKAKLHKGANGTLWAYANDNNTISDFTGPVGFQIGSRNNLRGPRYFNMDLGLGKTFPIWEDKVNLKFRCDAFNAFNHPDFNTPNNDITQSSSTFGVITGTANDARVLQGALRLEF